MEKIKYKPDTPDGFFKELKEEVEKYFTTNNISPYGGVRLYIKTIILLSAFIGIYISILSSSTWNVLILYTIQGFITAFIGFNIMHDASHGAYAKNETLNKIMSHSLELVGGSSFLWYIKHVLLHHYFTNTRNDDDIVTGGALYLTDNDIHKKHHRYQAFYAPLLYLLEYIAWVYIFDLRKYRDKNINGREFKMTTSDKRIFWWGKIFYTIYALFIPMFIIGTWKALIGFLIMDFVCGELISIVFQLAHIQPTSKFPSKEIVAEKSWAEVQMNETVDFATGNSFSSKIISFFLGGLNHQTVHHLFPRISHVHYAQIEPIVEKVSKKHNITYNKTSFISALVNHFIYLHKKGRQEI